MNTEAETVTLPGKKRRPFDIANLVLGRGLHVLVAGALLFVLLAPAAFIKRKPYYHTGGSVLVSPKVRQVLSREERIIHGSFHEFAETQAQRMLTTEVLVRAVESLPEEEWPSFLNSAVTTEEAAAILRSRLEATPVSSSYLLFVGLTGDHPEGLAPAVNAVMRAYIEKLETEQEAQSHRRLEYLRNEKAEILREIDEKKARQVELAAELKSRTFNELNNPYFESVLALQEQYVLARAEELSQAAELQRAERESQLMSDVKLDVLADDAVSRNEAVYLIDNWTYQKLQELRGTIDGLTADNPDRIYVEERMEAMDEYLVNFKKQLHSDFLRILTEKRGLEGEEASVRARAAHEASAQLTKQLRAAMDEATETFERSTELIAEGKELDDAIAELRDRFTLVDQSIREVSLDAKAPTHVSIEEPARVPTSPASDNLLNYLAMCFVAAFGLAGAVALALELLDSRVRGLRDLQHALGQPAPDAVALFPEGEEAVEADLCVYRRPDHPAAIAIRKLAVRLNRERERNGARVILFTGAAEGAGEEGVARNTAAALTQYLRKVLIVRIGEGFSRLPTLPLDHDGPALDLVRTGLERIEFSSRVASLELDAHDPLLQNRADFMQVIRRAGEYFDAIVIESGPVLEDDLSQFLVHQVDVAVVVARHRSTPYAKLRGCIEMLYRSSLPAFTAVLTGAAQSPWEQLLGLHERGVAMISAQGPRGLWNAIRARDFGSLLPDPKVTAAS